MLSRRTLIRGMGALLTAPAIVKAASLMPVRSARLGNSSLWLIGWGDDATFGLYPPNRTVRHYMAISDIRDRNVLLRPAAYAGQPVASFRGIPILIKDEATKWPTSPLETALMRGLP